MRRASLEQEHRGEVAGLRRGIRLRGGLLLTVIVLSLAGGCTPAVKGNWVSYIFDGVPAPPPPDTYCLPWLEAHQTANLAAVTDKGNGEGAAVADGSVKKGGSEHPPYRDKKCDSCHKKTTESGFIVPLRELCVTCHKTIVTGEFLHAPATAGNCLACHDPHSSLYRFLLKSDGPSLCSKCHQEQRQAKRLHDSSAKSGIACADCHNPHNGAVRYFLR